MPAVRALPAYRDYRIVRRSKRLWTAVADRVGLVASIPAKVLWPTFFRPGPLPDRHARVRILLVRLAHLGDIILTTAVPEQLKRWYPNATITFLTSSQGKELVATNPWVDEVVAFDPPWFYDRPLLEGVREWVATLRRLRRDRYDVAIDLRADLRNIVFVAVPSGARHRVGYAVAGGGFLLTHLVPFQRVKPRPQFVMDIIRSMGIPTHHERLDVFLTPDEISTGRAALSAAGLDLRRPFVMVHPGSRRALKCWPAERFAACADRLAERFGVEVVVTGGPGEEVVVRRTAEAMSQPHAVVCGALGLREFVALVDQATLVVTNDTFAVHAATTCGTAVVCVVGPSESSLLDPPGPTFAVAEVADMPCRADCDEAHCRHPETQACLRRVPVDAVTAAAAARLQRLLEGPTA